MKQALSILMTFFYIFSAFLSGGKVEQATLSLDREVTTESKAIFCELVNHTGRRISYVPDDFSLEKKCENEWIPLKYMDEVSMHDIAYSIPVKTVIICADIGNMYDPLELGEYRLVFKYTIEQNQIDRIFPNNNRNLQNTLYVEFTVSR